MIDAKKKITIVTKDIKAISDHLVIPRGDDTMMNGNLYEISVSGHCVSVDRELWESWTGRRYINGDEYHGPLFMMKSKTPYQGTRVCDCNDCQPNLSPTLKPN